MNVAWYGRSTCTSCFMIFLLFKVVRSNAAGKLLLVFVIDKMFQIYIERVLPKLHIEQSEFMLL